MQVYPWREVELTLTMEHEPPNPYTDLEVWAEFRHNSGLTLRRPAFWDGGRTYGIRFASPLAEGRWTWHSYCSVEDAGLTGQGGELVCEPGDPTTHRFYEHGFWRMSPGGRNLVHADGTPALLVGDTAWGLPWRATAAQCRTYAADRQAKGFNAVLLMSVQPDMHARGPRVPPPHRIMPGTSVEPGWRMFHSKRFMPSAIVSFSSSSLALVENRRTVFPAASRISSATSCSFSGCLSSRKRITTPAGGFCPRPDAPNENPPRMR